MPSPLTILTGPARSGKTHRLLAVYRAGLRGAPPRSTLWLAPTHRGVADILSRLPGPDLPGCLSPGVLTFEDFARDVLAASGRAMQPLSTLMKRQLVRLLIERERQAGRLRHFAPIADTHGLVDLVAAFISELKRLEIWPEDFRRACAARGLSDKDRELLAIYEAYQERLREHDLYDAEGRFWSARDLLTAASGRPPHVAASLRDAHTSLGETRPRERPFERLKLVVADGFTDFTRTQHEILALLATRAEAMYVSLPLESQPRREDLFAKAAKTLETLERRAPHGVTVEEMPRSADGDWPALEHLEAELFQNPRQARPAPPVERIEILGASREQGEIEQIGRRIKRLLTEGCDGKGDLEGPRPSVRPGEIAVVFRSLSDVAPLVREVFGELGIPFDLETSETLDETPLAAAVVAVLRLAVEDWPFRHLLAVLGNSYVRPDWPQWREGAAALAAERAVRSLQIPSGAQALLDALHRRIERLSHPTQVRGDQESHTSRRLRGELADASVALPLLVRLHEALAKLPSRASQAAWAVALTQLADEIGMLRVVAAGDEAVSRRDQHTWACLLRGLREGALLFEKIAETPPELTAAEFLALVIDLLRWQRLPRHHDDVGRVRVLSAASVRSLRVPYLFFAGLSERAFPSPDRHDRLYGEGEYRQLRERSPDLALPLRHERNQEEMLLFYEVLTRATRRLWLSYPALDAKAESLLPSPYLREVERACGLSASPPSSTRRDLCGLPPSDQSPQTERDFRLQAVDQALSGDASLLAMLGGRASAGLGPRILAGLELTRERAGASFGPFEGLLASGAVRDDVARRYGPQLRWTVSHLEQYALCPHQFFLQRLLGLEPLDELTLEPDYLERGGLIHDVLAELHRQLNEEARESGPPARGETPLAERIGSLVESLVLRILQQAGAEHDVQAALHEIDRRVLLQWLQAYRQQHEQYDGLWSGFGQPPRPAHFEVSFGLSPLSDDELSTDQPWELQHEGEKLLLCGRIDRLDLGQRDGQRVFNVIDYKSGRPRARRDDEPPDGRQLQLELYALAAQELLFRGQALALHAGYWYVKKEGYKACRPLHEAGADGWEASEFWRGRLQQVLDKVFSLVRGIRAAEFPMASLDEHCTSYCPFKTVCRVNQTRALGKTWQPPEKAGDVHA